MTTMTQALFQRIGLSTRREAHKQTLLESLFETVLLSCAGAGVGDL